jgi:hypothetical protein
MTCVGAFVIGLTTMWPAGLWADDLVREPFPAGGLQFEQTDKLRMERKDLYLSPHEVRVSYTFRNLTDHDVSGQIAFPMPTIDVGEMSETPHRFHKSTREGDIFDFHAEVNGQPVAAEYDVRATIKAADGSEKDVTDILRSHKVSLVDPDDPGVEEDSELAMAKIFVNGVHGPGTLERPAWILRVLFGWTQVFPAQKEVRITHRYKPILGRRDHSTAFDPDVNDPSSFASEWCSDEAFARAVKTLPAEQHAKYVRASWLEYILKTGANWTGPIGKFRLEIDKAGADLLSLCPIPGLKLQRRGQSFVAETAQYVPTTDIKLLFVHRWCDKAPCSNPGWPGDPR